MILDEELFKESDNQITDNDLASTRKCSTNDEFFMDNREEENEKVVEDSDQTTTNSDDSFLNQDKSLLTQVAESYNSKTLIEEYYHNHNKNNKNKKKHLKSELNFDRLFKKCLYKLLVDFNLSIFNQPRIRNKLQLIEYLKILIFLCKLDSNLNYKLNHYPNFNNHLNSESYIFKEIKRDLLNFKDFKNYEILVSMFFVQFFLNNYDLFPFLCSSEVLKSHQVNQNQSKGVEQQQQQQPKIEEIEIYFDILDLLNDLTHLVHKKDQQKHTKGFKSLLETFMKFYLTNLGRYFEELIGTEFASEASNVTTTTSLTNSTPATFSSTSSINEDHEEVEDEVYVDELLSTASNDDGISSCNHSEMISPKSGRSMGASSLNSIDCDHRNNINHHGQSSDVKNQDEAAAASSMSKKNALERKLFIFKSKSKLNETKAKLIQLTRTPMNLKDLCRVEINRLLEKKRLSLNDNLLSKSHLIYFNLPQSCNKHASYLTFDLLEDLHGKKIIIEETKTPNY